MVEYPLEKEGMNMERFTRLSLEEYLNRLSGDDPVPGGGSVAAYVASLAMGLTQMVGRISLKRKMKAGLSPQEQEKETGRRKTIQKIIDSVDKTKKDAFQIVNLDPEVYQHVMAAYGGEPEKLQDALQNAFRLQADLAILIVMARDWNNGMAGLVSGSIKNDLVVSADLLRAAFKGAYHTALINAHYMKKPEQKQRAEKALEELKNRFEEGEASGG